MTEHPFPRWAHVPGVTAGADEGPLEAVKALVPARFSMSPSRDHPAIVYGLALCDAGFFWEAHEVLEAVWIASPQNGRDRVALQAVIQLANAGLKLRMGRARAAARLLAEVRWMLGEIGGATRPDSFAQSLDATSLSEAVGRCAASLERGEQPTIPALASVLRP